MTPTWIASPNHDARPRDQAIDMLVIHYTGMPSAEAALARLTDPAAQVSAHWLVHEDGRLVGLVDEERRAWHAGRAFWRGERAINARSIGVEIVNPGHEFGYRPFPEAQMATVEHLCAAIVARHALLPWNVVAHADIAPTRKEDPGELFDWPRLARAGVGLGVPPADATAPPAGDETHLLTRMGYDTTDEAAAVRAFQRHYRPSAVTGQADASTRTILAAVAALCPPWSPPQPDPR
ncbi:N-acetylmuramoyl-L-alanine amidase [Pararhodospirillum oryzae]|uniref:N-acetylmuramoyl-L-alanine amidase n=1 Tax=Pararhodospirillum oryzae TaxID=478448 RepID=A0A512H4N6_9PROT|nr:N-acetylmuramoyl-L-alanine amidase [Pararhodospirillum oryzae]GEO80397.1 N-acetylmuramoyl-L-alanine amidase [Pararhodospirillum oryzae]